MKKRKFVRAAAVLVMLAVLGYAVFGSPVEMYRRRALRQAMAAVPDGEVTLNEIVPFAWDSVYCFEPYMSKEEMAERMGVPARGLTESVSEGMVQLVFLKDGNVVCDVCEYISHAGYAVSFDEAIPFDSEIPFQAERSADGILCLTEKNN